MGPATDDHAGQKKKEQRAADRASTNSASSISRDRSRTAPVLRPKPAPSAEISGFTGDGDVLQGPSVEALQDSAVPAVVTSGLSLAGISTLPMQDMAVGLQPTPYATLPENNSLFDADLTSSTTAWSSPSCDNSITSPDSIPFSSSSSASGDSLPDPFANALEFTPTIIFSACLHNAIALGFDLGALASCDVDLMSPFYRPALPSDDPASLLSSSVLNLSSAENGCAKTMTALPPDLRPTLNQVLIPHHASLDLIPFPLLRDRAIVLSVTMPQMFNMWELKLDIYSRGGLTVAKGSSGKNGTSIRRRQEQVEERWAGLGGSMAKVGGCQPWDRRSWVAKPWFLKKWRVIMGDEKDRLGNESLSEVLVTA